MNYIFKYFGLVVLISSLASCERTEVKTLKINKITSKEEYLISDLNQHKALVFTENGSEKYVRVFNCNFEIFEKLSKHFGKSSPITHQSGLRRNFSYITDNDFIPRGLNVSVFERKNIEGESRSNLTYFFIPKDSQMPYGDGAVIIHLR